MEENRVSQLFRGDVRDLTHIQEIAKLEMCATLLEYQSGKILNRATISKQVLSTIPTIGKWVEILKQFYYVFTIQPWSRNIPHSLVKEPKIFLYD